MKILSRQFLSLCCAGIAIAGITLLAGCTADTKLTPKEQANIKGTGVMPAEAREKVAQKMKEAQAKMAADNAVPGRTTSPK